MVANKVSTSKLEVASTPLYLYSFGIPWRTVHDHTSVDLTRPIPNRDIQARLGPASTAVGDHVGSPGVV
eukprot:3156695-Lingulodinium_polyedra.AAC.1